ISSIREEIFEHGLGLLTIEIDCLTPICFIAAAEVMRREGAEIVARRSEVIVNDVGYYSNSDSVRSIDESPEVVRTPIQPSGGEQVHAIVTPSPTSRKIRHGQNFQNSDAYCGKFGQFRRSRVPRAFPSESTNVHLV